MTAYVTRDREAGNVIDYFVTREEAEAAIEAYEASDKEEGTYEEDFYEVAEIEKDIEADTYGYGKLPVLDEDEEYKYDKGYNDAVIFGTTYTVAECEQNGIIVAVREKEDGSLFAVIEEA